MANIKHNAPDGSPKETKARGSGNSADPYVPETDANIRHNGALVGTGNRFPVDVGTAVAQEATLADIKAATGAAADAAATTDTGTFSEISLLKRGLMHWSTIISRLPPLSNGRMPVEVIFPNTQPVSGSVTANIGTSGDLATDVTLTAVRDRLGATDTAAATSDSATSPVNGLLKRALAHLSTIIGRLPTLTAGGRLPVDGSGVTQPISGTVTAQVDQSSVTDRLGSTSETAPTTDNATSGLNGRLQRIAQHFTTLLNRWPISLGQKNRAGSVPFTLATEDIIAIVPSDPATGAGQNAANQALGNIADAEASSGNGSLIALAKRHRTLLGGLLTEGTFTTRIPTIGQKTAAGSVSVVLASDQAVATSPLNVRGKLVRATDTPFLDVGGAGYSAGDLLGSLKFVDGLALSGGELLLSSVKALGVVNIVFDLIIFTAQPTNTTAVNNQPFNIAYADQAKVAGWFVFDGTKARQLDASSNNTFGLRPNLDLSTDLPDIVVPATGQGLWFAAVIRENRIFNGEADLDWIVGFARS